MNIKNMTGKIIHIITSGTLEYADLKEADLKGANLKEADLKGANLRWADLRGADLRGADLRWADLRGADLRGADLERADLKGANLRWADLKGVDLRGVDLRGADLERANLRGANLRGADLKGATYGKGIKMSKPPIQIIGYKYFILILDEHIKIGCELRTKQAWLELSDQEILDMDNKCLEEWRIVKPIIDNICK